MDSLDELLNSAEYFECEKLRCKLRLQVCLQRQQANQEASESVTTPFPNCRKCSQGEANRRFAESGSEMIASDPKKDEEERLCQDCGKNKTLGNSPFCARCLGRRGNEARKAKGNVSKPQKKVVGTKAKPKPKKAVLGQDTALTLDFGKHASILEEVEKLAEEEMRPVEMQVLFMLKKQLTCIKEGQTA